MTKAAPKAPEAPAATARTIVTRVFDEAETKAMKSGAPEQISPLLDEVKAALADGLAHGVGYGEDYKKNTVLAHLRKAAGQAGAAADKVLRTYDREDYKDAEGNAWPHIGFKWVTKPPAKAKAADEVVAAGADNGGSAAQ